MPQMCARSWSLIVCVSLCVCARSKRERQCAGYQTFGGRCTANQNGKLCLLSERARARTRVSVRAVNGQSEANGRRISCTHNASARFPSISNHMDANGKLSELKTHLAFDNMNYILCEQFQWNRWTSNTATQMRYTINYTFKQSQ